MAKKQNNLSVLIVDDEPDVLSVTAIALQANGIQDVIQCNDARDVLPLLEENDIGVILLDLSMPYISGDDLLLHIIEKHPAIPVIVVTASNRVEKAVECMKSGAFDYMVKPVENQRLISGVQRARELRVLRYENKQLKSRLLYEKLEHPEAFSNIISTNPGMLALFSYVEAIAASPEPVLITGETGVGKELIARSIHTLSRPDGPFVAVNVAGLDDSAFSDTLFGHRKGAFTGAESARSGLINEAAGGVLLLDEIGDLSLSSQIKLLRLIQEHEFFPLGSDVPRRTDVRFIFTTNRDLHALRDEKRFRSDLFYRLQTHQVHVPPLRERLGDIPLLLDHFLERSAAILNKRKPTPPDELISLLSTYIFPGNVRELEGMVFNAVSSHTSRKLSMDAFRSHIVQTRNALPYRHGITGQERNHFTQLESLPTLKEVTQLLIQEAMRRSNNNQTIAAQLLGITQPSLSGRLKRAERQIDTQETNM